MLSKVGRHLWPPNSWTAAQWFTQNQNGGAVIERDSKGRAQLGPIEVGIQVLIVLSLLAFAIDTLPSLPDAERELLDALELFTIGVFTIEYVARIILSRPAKSYIFSFYGIVDLIAILPYYLSGLDLRSVRAFRLLRLFRILKLARYSAALQRFHRAFFIVREELILFGLVASIVLYLSAVGIYYCEHEAQPEKFRSFFESLWWAISTLTTVGYGDIYPITWGGRFFTVVVLVVGLGVVAVPTGLVASALHRARDEFDAPR
jgi:voltage-gated potassium channel